MRFGYRSSTSDVFAQLRYLVLSYVGNFALNLTHFKVSKKPLGAPNMIIKGPSYYIETIFAKEANFANTLTEQVSHECNVIKAFAKSLTFHEICFLGKNFLYSVHLVHAFFTRKEICFYSE